MIRAIRRHHRNRLKRKRKKYYGRTLTGRELGKVVTTPQVCSCWLCGTQRKTEGDTVQERKLIETSRVIWKRSKKGKKPWVIEQRFIGAPERSIWNMLFSKEDGWVKYRAYRKEGSAKEAMVPIKANQQNKYFVFRIVNKNRAKRGVA